MKKTISLFFAACLAMGIQAQVYMVNDFESGLNGANAAWGGEVDWVDNPCSSNDNASSKVLKVVSTSYANVAIPVTLPEGKTLADYSGVRIQLAILENSSDITWVTNQLGLMDCDTYENTSNVANCSWGTEVSYNTWMTLDFNFDESVLATYLAGNHINTSLLIGIGREQFTYVIDNVRLIEKEQLADANTIFTFETMELGETSRCSMPWHGTCSVVENPYTAGINSSTKALQVNSGDCSPVTFSEALPTGKTWKDYTGLKFQLCILESGFEWGYIDMGVRTESGNHIKLGYAVDETTESEGHAYREYTPGEWFEVELKIDGALVSEEAEAVRTMYLCLMKNGIAYLYDNLTLIPASSSAVVERELVSNLKVYGADNQINLSLQKDMQVMVYSIDGRLVFSQFLSSGHHTVDLPRGVYIVNREKVAVF